MSGPPPGMRSVAPTPETATRLVLVRHGEARCNVEGVVGGERGCTGLTDAGRAQARALHARLAATGELARADALVASVLPRALETAALIAPAVGGGAPAAADCGVCELHPGEADGLDWDTFRRRYGEPDFARFPDTAVAPGGESWGGFVDRATAALAALAGAHPGGLVVVVCHAGVVEASMVRFLPVAPGTRPGLATTHTSLTEWAAEDGWWRLVRYNDAAHLAGGSAPPTGWAGPAQQA
ncbi:MAG TPA: histidine phosphatase family protein [Acidimicrobiales bacterium]|nr:histidine phosphatase family protein [Acidimicrobiales bacterium]